MSFDGVVYSADQHIPIHMPLDQIVLGALPTCLKN